MSGTTDDGTNTGAITTDSQGETPTGTTPSTDPPPYSDVTASSSANAVTDDPSNNGQSSGAAAPMFPTASTSVAFTPGGTPSTPLQGYGDAELWGWQAQYYDQNLLVWVPQKVETLIQSP
ncbi:hypothetical protein M231_04471 [Tremella mesenterica]|uniref:Uncharacterized protein n=1 Tax=Tremella mesenterica TaxID=5217 RepID=A0A4Q1BKI3_TREME|nr:hypothetical protein M231_04471 [Tremella mesenterica]